MSIATISAACAHRAITVRTVAAAAPSTAPPTVPSDTASVSSRPNGTRCAKTVQAALSGAAFFAVPAGLGCVGGVVGVVGAAMVGAAVGRWVARKDCAQSRNQLAALLGGAALIPAVVGALGGATGVIVMTGLGTLLGLAMDALNRGTRPGY